MRLFRASFATLPTTELGQEGGVKEGNLDESGRGQVIPGDGGCNLPDRNGKLIDGKQRLESGV